MSCNYYDTVKWCLHSLQFTRPKNLSCRDGEPDNEGDERDEEQQVRRPERQRKEVPNQLDGR